MEDNQRDTGRVRDADQALVATPSSPQAVLTEGFDPSRCPDCGGPNPVWFAPNAVWNFVMGGPDARDDPGGHCCPICFIARAEAVGVLPAAWELAPANRGTLLANVKELLVWGTKRGLTVREAKCALEAFDEYASGMETRQGGNAVPSRSDDSPARDSEDAHADCPGCRICDKGYYG